MNKRILILMAVFAWSGAWAHGPSQGGIGPHPHAATLEIKPFGRPGDPAKVSRPVQIRMSDEKRFDPSALRISRGETIRLVVTNGGEEMHEIVLGTAEHRSAHAERMKKDPDAEHDETWGVHVLPGHRETLVWQFTLPGEFWYACLVPGHYEAGMVGKITVQP